MDFIDNDTSADQPWRVLLVDDEPDVHLVTKLTLNRFRLDGQGLEFLSAYSAAEAKTVLSREANIALVFLDVVMETEHAGLELARWLRQDLRNQFTRIVLRTGQAGQAPEERVIVEYDINDYREKTDLDRKKLFTTTFAALRSYRDIMTVEDARRLQARYREGLERVLGASGELYKQRNLSDFSQALLQQTLTLLQADQHQSMQIRGETAIAYQDKLEILASTSAAEDQAAAGIISPALLARLQPEPANRITHLADSATFAGMFRNQSDKTSLLALSGLPPLSDVDARILDVFSSNVAIAFDNILLNQEISDTQGELIMRLGDVVESRSHEAGNHVRRMSEVCYLIALKSDMSAEQAMVLKQAAPMHDVGKIAIPDSVLLKPGKLTAEEWDIMQQHPAIGHSILDGSQRPILKAAAVIAHQHHEKFDGSGYPQGLSGEQIHPYARIVAVADVFDALIHARCYKPAWPVEQVLQHLREVSGKHLDPRYVALLIEHIGEVLEINARYPD